MSWDRQINIKTPQEIEVMRMAGRINAEALAAAKAAIQPGATTADVDAAAEEVLNKYGVISPFKGVPGPFPYPCSTTVSVNEELVHGIPGKRKLKTGDIVSVDCGAIYEGFVADAAFTAGVGEITPEAQKLIAVTEASLAEGIKQMRAGNHVGDVGAAIQKYAENHGFYLTREYTGHGVGRDMWEGPQVPNYGTPGRGLQLKVGMTIAIEPMLLVGTEFTRVKPDGWTVISMDGSLTAHFEHTIAITADGPLVLTTL